MGGLLLAALCVWVVYTNRHLKKDNADRKFFKVNPVELAHQTTSPGDGAYDQDGCSMIVPIVNMDSPELHNKSRKNSTNSNRRHSGTNSNRIRGVSFASSASEYSTTSNVKPRGDSFYSRNGSFESLWPEGLANKRVRTRSESYVSNLEEGSSMYSLPSEFSNLGSEICTISGGNTQ